ncbi:MAG: SusC/RagA family TonB-linked outer membrane protein [Chitinophagaceae bacterium]
MKRKMLPSFFRIVLLLNLLHFAGELHANWFDHHTNISDEYTKADITVHGTVRDKDGVILAGASVTEKGTGNVVVSAANGSFTIKVKDNAVLIISYVGYQVQEVPVNGRTTVDVVLEQSQKVQDAVVVIGYGTANKRDLTGSIVKVSGSEVADKPNTNPISSLQSKVAGLSIVNSGVPGEQPDIRIRGTVSMGSVNPLYVVDGIFTDNIDYLSPNNIESIEVLKDPSSLAIFGVKGASGVIAITTKRAKAGQVNVTLSTSIGTKKLVDKVALASGDDFRKIFAMEAANGLNDDDPTAGIKNTEFVNNEMSKWTGNTDWVDAITRTAGFYNTNLTLTAANDKNRFVMGLGYNADQGLVKYVEYKRFSINMSDEYKLNKFLKVGFNFVGSKENLPFSGSGQLYDARKTLPIIRSDTKRFYLRNPYLTVFDSAFYDLYSGTPVIQNTEHNPLLVLENTKGREINDRYRMVGSTFAEVTFLKDFNFRATYYADIASADNRVYTPVYYAYNPAAIGTQAYLYNQFSRIDVRTSLQKSFQQDYILNYKKTIGDHAFTAMLGNTWYQIDYAGNSAFAKQKEGDQPIPDNKRFWYASNGFATASGPSSSQWEYATVSFLSRLLYNYKSKYYFTGTFRRDYASNINDDYAKKAQNFWAIGLGWEITREDFMKNVKVFDYLKLKGSIGVLGNFNTGTIGGYYPFYPGVNATQATFGVNTVSVFENSYLPDPNLHWETVHAKEIGIEFNMLDNRLHGDINYYNKKTKDLLALLKPVGVLPTLTNSGEILNKGFEISASWNQKFNKDLSLTVGGNITTYNNKVLKLNYLIPSDPQYPNQTEAGYPIGYFIGYKVEGLYQSYADILASPVVKISGPKVQPGDFKYADLSGPDGKPDGVIDENDKTIIGNPTPDFTYGANVTLKYRQFDLGVDIAGVYGNEIYRYWSTSEQKNSVYNYPKYFLEAWNGPGTSNWVPIVDAQHLTNRVPSSFGIEDGSYIRIRNIGLGYNFKFSKAYIKNGRVYVNIQNLKTWKHNLGYSPEYGGSATAFGIDVGSASGALPRIFSAGFTLTF